MGHLVLVCEMMHVLLDEDNHIKLNPQNPEAGAGEGGEGMVFSGCFPKLLSLILAKVIFFFS